MDFRFAGKIKAQPEDFVVEEVWGDFHCTIDRPSGQLLPDDELVYLHATLIKRNWDTVKALCYIAKKLGVSLKRFGFAGMKDKRAVTAQRISIWHIRAEELARLRLPDMFLKDFTYSDDRINLGDAEGNKFTITISGIPLSKEKIDASLDAFREYIGSNRILNYFGSQRLGGNCDNAKVGLAIVNGRLDEAVNILLGKVRTYIDQGRIDDIPDIFWIEKRILKHLQAEPCDYAGALRKIPKKVLRIFPHAVQSEIFNAKLRQAVLAGDVPESIEVEGFEIEKLPELRTFAIKRNSYLDLTNFDILGSDEGTARICFTLGKGAYATTLLSNLLCVDSSQ